jgi:hypothetical protein
VRDVKHFLAHTVWRSFPRFCAVARDVLRVDDRWRPAPDEFGADRVYATVELRACNKGSEPHGLEWGRFQVLSRKGRPGKGTVVDREPKLLAPLEDVVVPPGRCVQGWVTWRAGDDLGTDTVTYTGSRVVTWRA